MLQAMTSDAGEIMVKRVGCVTAVLVNAQNQILLYQRDDNPNIAFPDCWSTLGGLVETGETPEEAIKRELMEEIELDVALKFWKVYERPYSPNITIIQHVFIGQLNKPTHKITLNEGQRLAYFAQNELPKLQIGFGFEALLQEFFTTFTPPQSP